MAKILIQEKHKSFWFERLSVISYYSEGEFERRLINQASSLFRDYYVVPFKKTIAHVNDASNTTTPDLAFIKKDYTSWLIVEVELKSHDYEHVKRQVDVMRKPDFNKQDIIAYLTKQEPHVLDPPGFSFDAAQLTTLITTVKAGVMVIVDQTHEGWEGKLNKVGVLLCVVQAYRNGDGEEILRIKGQFPKVYTGFVFCRIVKDPVNSIEVINHHELLDKLVTGDRLEIYLKEILTKWTAIRKRNNKLFLKCMGSVFPLLPGKDFLIKFDEHDNVYLFETI